MRFKIPQRYRSEASYLCFDGRVRLKNNVNGLAVSGQEMSVANKDEKTIQVLGEPKWDISGCDELRFKLNQKASSPKPTVCTLVSGNYLPCGIGLSDSGGSFCNLTSVDIRRWQLCASAISEILKSTPPRNEHIWVKIDRLYEYLEERQLDEVFAFHIPNFTMEDIENSLDEYSTPYGSVLRDTGLILLFLLRFFIPLTAAYGGIHLSAWNFEFPTRVESIIWRTACFIIIGSSFALLAGPSWSTLDNYFHYRSRPRDWRPRRAWKLMEALNKGVGLVLAVVLLLCYVSSRLYLVVESFISLRHVPIGVYAAVPWVENIPHV